MSRVSLIVALACGLVLSLRAAAEPACDRACLDGLIGQYLTALAANDPSHLAVTKDFKLTENTAVISLGDGLWRTATGLGRYRLSFADPQGGAAGAIVVVQENGVDQLMALRLKVRDRKIAEAEMVIARKGEGQTLVTDSLTEPLPELLQAVPTPRRSSRAELIQTADKYFTAIEKGDGSLVPFAEDGFRIENGIRTCNDPSGQNSTGGVSAQFARLRPMHCADQLSTKVFTYIQSITPRRHIVVDEERGLVLSIVRFNHPGRPISADIPGFGKLDYSNNPWARSPTSAFIAELFKVEDHKITRVMAVITKIPYRGATGWE